MNNDASFQRLAAVTSILAALLAFGSIGSQAVVLGVNTDPFSNPTSILGSGASGANLLRWGMILDMFGYYLLLAPLARRRSCDLAHVRWRDIPSVGGRTSRRCPKPDQE